MGGSGKHEAPLADINVAISAGPGKDIIQPEFVKPENVIGRKTVIGIETGHRCLHQSFEPYFFDTLQIFLARYAKQVFQNPVV